MREPTLSWERVARRRRDGCGAAQESDPVPLLPRRRHPQPSPAWRGCRPQAAGVEGTPDRIKPSLVEWERLFSLIRHALRRATFPVGEGDLRRGDLTGEIGRLERTVSVVEPSGAMWASPPTRRVELCRTTKPGLNFSGVPSTPAAAAAPSESTEVRGSRKEFLKCYSFTPTLF